MRSKILCCMAAFIGIAAHGQVLPPHSEVLGKSIAEWTVEYWRWVYSLPVSEYPPDDPEERWAHQDASMPVFFVAGADISVLGTNIHRRYAVPEGKYMLVPILIATVDNIDVIPPLTVEEIKAQIDSYFTPLPSLAFSLDGVPEPNMHEHREMAPVFAHEFLFEDNLFTYNYGKPILGEVDPIIADGYWLMIEPLPPGEHVLHWKAGYNIPGIPHFQRTDIVTVVPVPLFQRVEELLTRLDSGDLTAPRLQPLRASLEAARASFVRGDVKAGGNQLHAFQNKVRAQVAPGNPGLATEWIQDAQVIRDRAARAAGD